ncbi:MULTISPECIES: hypothetical protein [unclassified Nocardia]|uniref:hypothetical protein n=1 Tax=unclassified Nocardia TaxID=2637762 RepID=UPI001CE46263|nr:MULTISPECIES: hypothetical protein [unclassified Nocardia]
MGDNDKPSLPVPSLQDLLDQQKMQAAQQKASEAQGRVQRQDQSLTDLGAGTDPDYVRTVEHFESMTHEAIYQAVHGPGGMDAAGLQSLRRTWFDTYSDLVNLSTFNLIGLNRIFGNGLWQGASGDAAKAASEQFTHAANQIGQVFSSVTDRLDTLSWSAEALKTAVQPPPTVVTTPDPDNPAESILPGLVNPAADDQASTAREQARQAAIRAVNSIYTPAFPPAGTGVPAYMAVPQVSNGGDAPDSSISGKPGDTVSRRGNDPNNHPPEDNSGSPKQDPTDPNADPSKTQPTATDPSSATNPTSRTAPDNLSSGTKTDPAATSTTPAGLNPGTTTSPGSPALNPKSPPPANPSTPNRSNPGPGSPGTLRPGLPGTTPPGIVTPGIATRGAPTTAAGQTGSLAPGAARRKEDNNETEHRAPDYLRQVHPDWTDGLGPSIGVIGDDLDVTSTGLRAETASAADQYIPTASPAPSPPVDLQIPHYVDDAPGGTESPSSAATHSEPIPDPDIVPPELEHTPVADDNPMSADQMAELLRLAGLHDDRSPEGGPARNDRQGQADTNR